MGNPINKVALLVLVCAFASITGCGDDVSGPSGNQAVASETFYYRFDVTEQLRLAVTGISGDITITGVADSDSIVVKGTKRVKSWNSQDAEEHLDSLNVIVLNEAGVVSAETDQPAESGGRVYEVDYEIIIPVNLEVSASDVNGTVSVTSMERRVTAATVNGLVELDGIIASVSANVVNGYILGDVSLPIDGLINMGVVNGEIGLEIPTDTSAQFSAAVANGTIEISNLVLYDMVTTSVSVTGRLGDGQGTISLSVVNGGIYVEGF